MPASASLTPMFRQYHAVKRNYPHAILLFRMGDFYEMFYEDAEEAARLLELTLTARGKGTRHVVPMCGFPHHQLDAYCARLAQAGRTVAICEQLEDPRKAKGLVRRDVVRVVTPGTVTDPNVLDSRSNAWICAVAHADRRVGAAFADLSTGEMAVWESGDRDDPWTGLADRLEAMPPGEVLFPEGMEAPQRLLDTGLRAVHRTDRPAMDFDPEGAREALCRHFGVQSLAAFGLKDLPAATAAAGALYRYLAETQKCSLSHLDTIRLLDPEGLVGLDPATLRNLEIDRPLRHGQRGGTLVSAVDATVTPMGGRLLRRWLREPSASMDEILRRHDAVEDLVQQRRLRESLREDLARVQDMERLLGRCVTGSAGPRDLAALRSSLEALPDVRETLAGARAALLGSLAAELDLLPELADRLRRALVDDPPAGVRDGGVIREGYDDELDALRAIRRDGRAYLASLETREREATGIPNLKVRYNKVFGYFIEVSRSHLPRVPAHYQRKQTLAGAERFVTPEIKEYESKVLNAQERIEALEYDRFVELREAVAAEAARIKATSRAVASLDVLASFAETAARHHYVRPELADDGRLEITGGRHPVVEQALGPGEFVPNDTVLGGDEAPLAIVTGPNMGGKSTYLRQVGLIVLLAQAGSFVPAERAVVGLTDRIFCRVGASDNLAEGQSTFMVEMTETAHILRTATRRSLVLLDEIGRGTSTFDGLSIAWAVVEHLHALAGGSPRTLFATHYHELTELAVALPGVRNLRMAVKERGEDVAFLHRVEPGASDRSYGIHVARLAGVPLPVIRRAEEILANLERDEFGRDGLPRRARRRRGDAVGGAALQASLFSGAEEEPPPPDPGREAWARVAEELLASKPETLTPLEALNLLASWRERLQRAGGPAAAPAGLRRAPRGLEASRPSRPPRDA